MSSFHRPVLAPLPLLLWKTPPGLELILAQEGLAYEVVRDAHPFAFGRGRFVLFDSQQIEHGRMRGMLTHDHVAIDIDSLRGNEAVDPFQALIDHHAERGIWKFRGWSLCERVSRYPKSWIRRRLLGVLRQQVLAAGGLWIRLAPFPHPFRSAFNFRVDLDEPVPEDYHRFALTRNLLADCCTHFVSTHAYADQPEVISDLKRYDTQSHGHFHYVYRDPESNYRNLERAHQLLSAAGLSPSGFAAPHGRWNQGLDDAMESLGYEYSSDFQLGYDDYPFFPWKGGRFSRVLQLPVHPVCEGLFLDAGVEDSRVVEQYLCRVVAAKVQGGEPALVYGHPERRLGRMPEILIALHRVLEKQSLVWRTTLTDLARWWRWRSGRRYMVLPRVGNQFEIQFDEWDPEYPLAMEICRPGFSSLLPLSGPRTVVALDELVYERCEPPRDGVIAPPTLDHRHESLKAAVARALDWETVTPLHELSAASLPERLKKGLRWWKLQRTGTGG
jgi:peptidoglycan/xylan/chitin deacetylase (PgdA/CDA1 family)